MEDSRRKKLANELGLMMTQYLADQQEKADRMQADNLHSDKMQTGRGHLVEPELGSFRGPAFYRNWGYRFSRLGLTGIIGIANTNFDDFIPWFDEWIENLSTQFSDFRDLVEEYIRDNEIWKDNEFNRVTDIINNWWADINNGTGNGGQEGNEDGQGSTNPDSYLMKNPKISKFINESNYKLDTLDLTVPNDKFISPDGTTEITMLQVGGVETVVNGAANTYDVLTMAQRPRVDVTGENVTWQLYSGKKPFDIKGNQTIENNDGSLVINGSGVTTGDTAGLSTQTLPNQVKRLWLNNGVKNTAVYLLRGNGTNRNAIYWFPINGNNDQPSTEIPTEKEPLFIGWASSETHLTYIATDYSYNMISGNNEIKLLDLPANMVASLQALNPEKLIANAYQFVGLIPGNQGENLTNVEKILTWNIVPEEYRDSQEFTPAFSCVPFSDVVNLSYTDRDEVENNARLWFSIQPNHNNLATYEQFDDHKSRRTNPTNENWLIGGAEKNSGNIVANTSFVIANSVIENHVNVSILQPAELDALTPLNVLNMNDLYQSIKNEINRAQNAENNITQVVNNLQEQSFKVIENLMKTGAMTGTSPKDAEFVANRDIATGDLNVEGIHNGVSRHIITHPGNARGDLLDGLQ